MGNAQPAPGIELAQWIRALRAELLDAQRSGAQKSLHIQVGLVGLELEVTTTFSADARGGLRVWVLDANTGTARTRTSIQCLRLTLQPVGAPDGNDNHERVLVSDTKLSAHPD
ncbi:trypco2 family protein [Embleya hyalina]|uniref:Trypsin-co-occurring domain-containing protein n=1 Tax=Embleya hyalina TaxID=516124 RepID=A0A401YNJ0_9ACTN|nr:trypco2 family protein [Embleya hyalina]GCD96166.1 hypothetical protein EHYA_03850 [Embleya hyalina]